MFMSTFEWATTIGKFNQLILVIFILAVIVVQHYSRASTATSSDNKTAVGAAKSTGRGPVAHYQVKSPSNQFLHKLDSKEITTTDGQPASATLIVDNCTSGSGQAGVVAGKPADCGREPSFQAESPPMYFLQMPNGKVTTVLARQPAKTRLHKKSDGSFYVQILSIPSDRRAIRDKKIEASMTRGTEEDAKYSKDRKSVV